MVSEDHFNQVTVSHATDKHRPLLYPVSLCPTARFLFVFVPHFYVLLFPVLPPLMSYSVLTSTSLSLSLCISLWLCLQWRGSGWTGLPGLSALFPVAPALSRGSGVAACRFMAGRSVRGRMRKLVSAPTRLVGVSFSLVGLQS